ncbi:MAG: chemotaxis protein CheB [Chitinophagaceae bacterium]
MENKKLNKSLKKSPNQFPVVGVGASAGGLDAFKKILKAIPPDSGMAYVLVQHLDPNHDSLLTQLLQKVTSIPVHEISDDIKVEPNHIYIIPSNKMLLANDGVLELSPRLKGDRTIRNLPIDLFFRSLAEVHQSHAIGVVLSGTGSDGTAGLGFIKENGGLTFAQEEATALYPGMPHSAVKAGVADYILPPEQIPQKIIDIQEKNKQDGTDNESVAQQDIAVLRQILSLLRIRKGTDFTYYKQATIRRRITRRMAVNKMNTPLTYLAFLRDNPDEQDLLYQDLLIPVTAFFRDAKTFENLCEKIFPQIIKNKTAGEPIRVWVAGCSTGQEAYSIAICLKEFLVNNHHRVQIFASDISEPAVTKARSGIYSKAEVEGVSPQRLTDCFTKLNGSYHLNKFIREQCVFAVHNFLTDPPFGKMDFISCRNALIYMDPYLQKRVLTTFHYALKSNGFLLLGKSESINNVADLFGSALKNEKLFLRKDVPSTFMQIASHRTEERLNTPNQNNRYESSRADFQKIADDIILTKYSPPGVIVNDNLEIVHFRGNTTIYLEQLPGKPSHNLIKMARSGLGFELRNIVRKAKKEKTTIVKNQVPILVNGIQHDISIEAIPLPNSIEPYYLILFQQHATADGTNELSGIGKLKVRKDDKDLRIAQLEQELAQTRLDMQIITEDQDAVNKELQSDNEDLLSGSEELQSLNEELETNKEELQSTNEELLVVNQEMINLNELVTEARDYSEAIVATIRTPLLVLDRNLRVKTANNSFYKTFRVDEFETEGRLIYDIGNGQWDMPELRPLLEKVLPAKSFFAGFEIIHSFPHVGRRVMLFNGTELLKGSISEKLILLAIEDITDQKKAEDDQRQIDKRFHFIADSMPQKVFTADETGQIKYYNKIWLDYVGLTFDEIKDRGWENIVHPDDLEETNNVYRAAIESGQNYEAEHRFLRYDGAYRWHLSRATAQKDTDGVTTTWIGSNTDIQTIKEEESRKADFIKMVSHELKTPVTSIKGYAQLLLMMLNQDKDYQYPELLKSSLVRIDNLVMRLTRLITEMLDLSRIEADRLELKYSRVSINDLVLETVEDIRQTNSKHTIEVFSQFSCQVNIDPSRIEQVIVNLVNNAIKYSTDQDKIEIWIKKHGDKMVAISIRDFGIGIDKKEHTKIFERFYRVEGKLEQTYSGFGIGLFIVNTIVERHNGTITIESEKGKGSTFTFTLPVASTLKT